MGRSAWFWGAFVRAVGARLTGASLALVVLVPVVWAWPPGSAEARPPAIEHVEPTSGPPGTLVDLIGRRFSADASVSLGNQPLEVTRTLPSRVTVRVPEGAVSGRLSVTSHGETAQGPEFRVTQPPPAPRIDRVEPTSGNAGTQVVIHGAHFSPRLTGNLVDVGGTPAVVRAASPVALTVIVPEGASTGALRVQVLRAGEAVSKKPFTVEASTAVMGFSPLRAGPGAELLVSGVGFSDDPKKNRVYIASRPAEVLAANAKQLKVRVPERVASGAIMVDVQGAGRARSEVPFTVQAKPVVLSLQPSQARPGAAIIVRGSHFGSDPAAVVATLAGKPVRVTSASPTELTIFIPEGAGSGPVAVTVNGVGPSEARPLTVLGAPVLTRFSPRSGPAGSVLTLSGEGLASGDSPPRVMVGATPAEVISASPTQVTVRVPDARSGRVRVEHAGVSVVSTDPFLISRPPVITGVTPARVEVGGELTIVGQGFGTNAALLGVRLGRQRLSLVSVQPDRIVARAPARPIEGKLVVSLALQGQTEASEPSAVVAALRVASVAPAQPEPGALVTVRGGGFVPGETSVTLAGVPIAGAQVEATRIRFPAPDRATAGELVVKLADGREARAPVPLQPPSAGPTPTPPPAATAPARGPAPARR